jgi:hypothetical protein
MTSTANPDSTRSPKGVQTRVSTFRGERGYFATASKFEVELGMRGSNTRLPKSRHSY